MDEEIIIPLDNLSGDDAAATSESIEQAVVGDDTTGDESSRRGRGKVKDLVKPGNGMEGMEEGEITIPYKYPTGVISIDQLDMLPMMNVYDLWTATPGMTGEPLDSFTLLLNFEGMGAQDLTVGLAHKRGGGKGGMYQLIIGNKGNLQVDLEKKRGRRVETIASAAGLLCASNKAHKYWIAVKNGRIDFGVGSSCGQQTVLSHRDAEDPIEVRFVGFTCLRHKALFRDIRMEAVAGGPLRGEVETNLIFVRAEGCDEGFSGEDKASLDSALVLYKKECENMKRRARNARVTIVMKKCETMTTKDAPTIAGALLLDKLREKSDHTDWVPWTLVKRLSWNRDLDGGIDSESKEERQKRKLRAERFGVSNGSTEIAPGALKTPLAARVNPEIAEMMTEEKRFARSQKFSIPDQMWKIQAEEQGLRPADIFCRDPDRADPQSMATMFPHKVHVFSLDKTVCKQIRDNDVKAYFEGFCPKYVEWLSDWSFNVVFEDAEEAKNAAGAKSFGLPEGLPQDVADSIVEGNVDVDVEDLGSMGWRLGVPMCKVKRDRHGPKGQWASLPRNRSTSMRKQVRLLLRCAEEQDILLERPQTPAKHEGPIPRRQTGNKLPPAVRAAQESACGGGIEGIEGIEEKGKRRGGGVRGGGSGRGDRGGDRKKRGRRDDEDIRDEILGQALKAPRTSSKRREADRNENESDATRPAVASVIVPRLD